MDFAATCFSRGVDQPGPASSPATDRLRKTDLRNRRTSADVASAEICRPHIAAARYRTELPKYLPQHQLSGKLTNVARASSAAEPALVTNYDGGNRPETYIVELNRCAVAFSRSLWGLLTHSERGRSVPIKGVVRPC